MKKIILFVAFVLGLQTVQAQTNNFVPYRSKVRYIGLGADSSFYIPFRDTTFIPFNLGFITRRPQDSLLYVAIKTTAGGKHWDYLGNWIGVVAGGATIDTTSLSIRINLKLSISDTLLMLEPYSRIQSAATGSIVMWKSSRDLGSSSILYDNGTNAGATATFLAPSMKSASSPHYYSFRVDGNNGLGEVFSDGSYIQRLLLANYHYIQSFNTPANGMFIGVYPGSSYMVFKNDGRLYFNTLTGSAQKHTFGGSGRFTDTLFGLTLSNLADSSDVVATTKWVKQQNYGAGVGSSDGYVDGGSFNTTTNTITLTQSGSAPDVSIRIPPSYILNTIDPDSTSKQINDSTMKLKAVTVASDLPDIGISTTRTDTTLRHTLVKINISEPLVTFSAGAGFASDTSAFTDSTIYGSFYTGLDSFYITNAYAVIKGQSGDTLGVQIIYNDSINVTGTIIGGGTLAVNSRTIGNSLTISSNQGIPPNSWVWLKSPTVIAGKKPEYFTITLAGYRKYITP